METHISKSKAVAHYRVGKGTLQRLIEDGRVGVVLGTDRSGTTIELLCVADLEAVGIEPKNVPHDCLEQRIERLSAQVNSLNAHLLAVRKDMCAITEWVDRQSSTTSSVSRPINGRARWWALCLQWFARR
jgi:predicted type IV restriction endonuclease